MDVPSWHPANEDAALSRRLLAASASAAPQRTEFKLMPGSTADTSTDAGRELLSELTRGADGGSAAVEGRGFFDSSDRMYLQEQKRLEVEKHAHKRQQDLDELRKFRATALKVQAQKTSALVAAATDVPKKFSSASNPSSSSGAATLVIKTKKRNAPEVKGATAVATAKPTKQRKASGSTISAKANVVAPKAKTVAAPAAMGSLLLGYSSSDSDSDSGTETTREKASGRSTDTN